MRPPTPEIILTTKDETFDWLRAHDETFDWYRHPIKSLWLCDELNRFEAETGFVYNRQAGERVARDNGMTFEEAARRVAGTHSRTEGGLLGALVYLAQGYRAETKLLAGGWVRASQEALAPFDGLKVQAHNNGSLSGDITAHVKRIDGRLRLCPLRTRNRAYAEYEDWWIRPLNSNLIATPDEIKVTSEEKEEA